MPSLDALTAVQLVSMKPAVTLSLINEIQGYLQRFGLLPSPVQSRAF